MASLQALTLPLEASPKEQPPDAAGDGCNSGKCADHQVDQ